MQTQQVKISMPHHWMLKEMSTKARMDVQAFLEELIAENYSRRK